ncbi:oxytocin-neurophysin 1 isoform X2 [Clupea harengus]|uniref:Oxytocin-neurophysin 1 isoform X2 n=1 Tax=Clupea harengus TaxID=7950 RepID=A0A6P8GF99_CLUHA|nr:oxytocin-neurophysin 1 isoform X2 [Clupea harengus]
MSGAPGLVFCLLCLLSVCTACYISNCPIGGKRALQDLPRKCLPCGPGDRGRCFGPSICCGEGMGCYLGSPETARCLEENFLPSPCEAGGRACGSEDGHCAAPGICCDSEGCAIDQSCLDGEDEDTPLSQSENSKDLLMKLLHISGQTHPFRLHQ